MYWLFIWNLVTDFIFFDSKITADGDWRLEIKRHLFFGRKAMTNLDSMLKSRDITLPTKIPHSQSYGFSSNHVWLWELDHNEELSTEELMLSNYDAGKGSWESLGLPGDQASQS